MSMLGSSTIALMRGVKFTESDETNVVSTSSASSGLSELVWVVSPVSWQTSPSNSSTSGVYQKRVLSVIPQEVTRFFIYYMA